MNIKLWNELNDRQAEKACGGTGENVPPGFYDPESGFNPGFVTSQQNGSFLLLNAVPSNSNGEIFFRRVLKNGKVQDWGLPPQG